MESYKKMNKRTILLPLLVSITLPITALFADDAELVKNKCGACHGADGNSTQSKIPSIAGFASANLEDILEQYKSGDRKGDKYTPEGGKEGDMENIAKNLSDDDSKKIIAYLAAQKFTPVKQPIDEALAKTGQKIHEKKCEKCHTDNGSNPEDESSILAGQWEEYLTVEFKKITDKERNVPKKMFKKFKKLSADDKKALIKFYTSKQ